MGRELKKHISISDQIAKLQSRGLEFSDIEKANAFLDSVNYYRFSGYLFDFKKDGEESYSDGLTFNAVSRIYRFDCRFTRILMYVLEDIEESFKTKFSYTLSSAYVDDPCIYLDKKIYRSMPKFLKFASLFESAKTNNSELPFIKHHNKYYNGQLPVWVAVEILTMGNLNSLYDNLIPSLQKSIAKKYGTGTNQLISWLENMTYTRNHLAHYMRVYNYNFGRTPAMCNNHKRFSPTGKIYDQIMAMSYMYSDAEDWNGYVIPEIERILYEFSDVIQLKGLGFPNNWKIELTK